MLCWLLLAVALADPPVTEEATEVTIPVGKSALVQLPAEARAVSVTDASVVLAVQLSPTLWQLQGRSLGSTDCAIVHADGELELLDLQVQRDLSVLERAIERVIEGGVAPAPEPGARTSEDP